MCFLALGTPDILQYVQVPILDTKECHQSYQDGGFFPNSNNITNNMFCAGFYEGGKDTCSVSDLNFIFRYRQVSNIRRTLVGNKIVDHSDVVGASPVGAAQTTSSFST